MQVIHISFAGPEYRIRCGKWHAFEDHHYCGPIFIGRDGDPLKIQPTGDDPVWSHVNAWYAQGKRFEVVGKERWAKYTTDRHQTRRDVFKERREMKA